MIIRIYFLEFAPQDIDKYKTDSKATNFEYQPDNEVEESPAEFMKNLVRDKDWIQTAELRNQQSLETIQKACKMYDKTKNPFYFEGTDHAKQVEWSEKSNFIGCIHSKVGSITWLTRMAYLAVGSGKAKFLNRTIFEDANYR